MYGDIRVARISVDLSGRISSIIRIESADHMPPGTMAIGQETTMWLRSWWNEGRQFGNFGILRGPESLRPIGFAPIFDTGSSMGFDQPTVWIRGKRPWMSARRDHPQGQDRIDPFVRPVGFGFAKRFRRRGHRAPRCRRVDYRQRLCGSCRRIPGTGSFLTPRLHRLRCAPIG